PVIVVPEDAVEDLLLVLAEVVVAETGGQVELVAHRQRAFAEERELIELVIEIGPEEAGLRSAQPACRDPGQILEADHRQVLSVVPMRVAEEAARDPRESRLAAGK